MPENTSKSNITFSLEDIATYPLPGHAIPNSLSFSNDDKTLTYLFATSDDPIQKLYALDGNTGERRIIAEPLGDGVQENTLSPEEVLRRQRERMLAVGITHYSRQSDTKRLLIPLMGDIYVQDTPDTPLRKVVDSTNTAPALNATMTADGQWIAFVRDDEVYVVSTEGGTPLQITTGARDTGKTHGLAEYIAQEELGRNTGFWWSNDSKLIAFAEVDETHIPKYHIIHQGKDSTGDGTDEVHRYPFAGGENANVRLGVIPREGGETVWMDTDFGEEIYVADVFWWGDNKVGAEILNRAQNKFMMVKFDPTTGERTTILEETSEYWINRRSYNRVLLDNGDFLNTSERTGYNHIYLYDAQGNIKKRVTDGDWIVDKIASVDEANGVIFFTASKDHPTESHLYRVNMNDGEITKISADSGTHSVIINHEKSQYIDIHTALNQPPQVTLRDIHTNDVIQTIHAPNDPRLDQFQLTPPEIVTLQNRLGDTLYGALYRPPPEFGDGPFPTVVHVYGGPGPQLVRNSYELTANLQLQYLRLSGFAVFRLDNRGSARRGLEFEGALQHRMGTVEVDDQVDGIRWLTEQGITDPTRVGIFGWSYGGYMSLMCLAKADDVFKVAVSGAPVTHWDGYDTAYTERYMSTPQDNPTGYKDGSVMAHVDSITGKLLLIHGMIDENVHFRHTARLINALIKAGKDYDLLLFPDERHMPRQKPDRTYLNERIVRYFLTHL